MPCQRKRRKNPAPRSIHRARALLDLLFETPSGSVIDRKWYYKPHRANRLRDLYERLKKRARQNPPVDVCERGEPSYLGAFDEPPRKACEGDTCIIPRLSRPGWEVVMVGYEPRIGLEWFLMAQYATKAEAERAAKALLEV